MTEHLGSGRRFDVRLRTNEEEHAVPDNVIQLPGGSTPSELNCLVNSLLSESEDGHKEVQFDFLVEGQLLRFGLEDHLEELASKKGDVVNAEREIEVHYFVKQGAPEPQDSLLHDDWVASVDTNDQYILSGCYDGSINIWKFDGSHVVSIPAHNHPVKSVSWMDSLAVREAGVEKVDGKELLFVSGSHDETIKIWKWNPSRKNKIECLSVFVGHTRSVDCMDVNADLIASGSFDRLLKLWSLKVDTESPEKSKKTGKRQKDEEGQAVEKTVKTIPNQAPLLTLSGHTEAITGVAWMTDKKSTSAAPELVTCSMDNTLRVWDIEVNSVKQTIVGSKAFLSVSYSSERNDILTSSADRHIRLWDPRVGSVVTTFTSHHGWVSCISFCPNNSNLFVSGSYDENVKYWDVRLPKASLYDLIGHKDKVLCLNWNQPGHIVSGSADNQVKIFSNHY